MIIVIKVPSVPVAQPRQRHTVRGGHVHNYTPGKHPVNAFKASVQHEFAKEFSGSPLQGPLCVDMTFVLPRPKGMFWKRKPMPRVPHDKKPDRDNLEKSVMDALSKLAWLDDSQVCDGRIQKWIAAGDEQPHVLLVVKNV